MDKFYANTVKQAKQKHAFAFSNDMSMRERIDIFRAEFPEFSNLDEEYVRHLIFIYDKNIQQLCK